MPGTHAAAMSPAHTGSTNAGSYSASSSNTASGASATAATAATAATTAATTTTSSEQRSRRCDQQCGYGGYCKQLGNLRHNDLLFAFNSALLSQGQNDGARRWLKVERSTRCSAQNVIE